MKDFVALERKEGKMIKWLRAVCLSDEVGAEQSSCCLCPIGEEARRKTFVSASLTSDFESLTCVLFVIDVFWPDASGQKIRLITAA